MKPNPEIRALREQIYQQVWVQPVEKISPIHSQAVYGQVSKWIKDQINVHVKAPVLMNLYGTVLFVINIGEELGQPLPDITFL